MVEEPTSPSFSLLLEVAQRDVAPDVADQVDQDGVGARHGVEQLGHVVVRLDLDGVGVEGQAQRFDEDLAAKASQSKSG
jgi:glutathione S-transferase